MSPGLVTESAGESGAGAGPESKGRDEGKEGDGEQKDRGDGGSEDGGGESGADVDVLDLDRLTYVDQNVLDLFRRGDTKGVFQFESGGMRDLLMAMKPDRLEDLIAANALYRPGPMDLIPDYNDRKHERAQVPTVHDIVDRITDETYGIMVYQEQVMQVLNQLGGIPLRKAYTIIKAISKKKEDGDQLGAGRFRRRLEGERRRGGAVR